jgi:hypothetical protein
MIRPILIELALFLTPYALYAFYLWITKTAVLDRLSWPPRIVGTLAICALVLMLGSFFVLAEFGGSPPGSEYIPAHIDATGKFVPGQVR